MKKLFCLCLLLLTLTGCREAAAGEAGYVFPYKGETIAMHGDFAPVFRSLGQPISCTEEPSCAFEGVDRTYYYGSFYVQTHPDQEQERICSLWFADDSVATEEGIFIGSPRETVEAAYGPAGPDGNWFLEKGNSELVILTESGLVSSIQYTALGGQ